MAMTSAAGGSRSSKRTRATSSAKLFSSKVKIPESPSPAFMKTLRDVGADEASIRKATKKR